MWDGGRVEGGGGEEVGWGWVGGWGEQQAAGRSSGSLFSSSPKAMQTEYIIWTSWAGVSAGRGRAHAQEHAHVLR